MLADAARKEEQAAGLEARIAQGEAQLQRERQQREREDQRITQHIEAERVAQKAFTEAPILTLQDVIGVWAQAGSESTMAIVQQDPGLEARKYEIEAHTQNRIWKGEYLPRSAGIGPRVKLSFTPRAAEMNPDVPLWARQAVEGELNWQLDLYEQDVRIDPVLNGRFYPGQIKWSESGGERVARVVGKGVMRQVRLPRLDDISMNSASAPSLFIQLPGTHNPLLNPVEGLIKGQPFYIRLSAPAEIARDYGRSVTVEVSNERGESTTVELTTPSTDRAGNVIYAHYDRLVIANATDSRFENRTLGYTWAGLKNFLATNFVFPYEFDFRGPRLDLEVRNGEKVTFRYGTALQEVTLYETWVQRALAQQAEAADNLDFLSRTIEQDEKLPAVSRSEATKRLQMLQNYRDLVASEYLTDMHRYLLGEAYLNSGSGGNNAGIFFLSRDELTSRAESEQADPNAVGNYLNPTMRIFLSELTGSSLSSKVLESTRNIHWTSADEHTVVARVLKRPAEEISGKQFEETVKNFTFGLYTGLVSISWAGDLVVTLYGHDHFGKKQPWQERFGAAFRLGAGAFLAISETRMFKMMTLKPNRFRLLGDTRSRRWVDHDVAWERMPASLDDSMKAQLEHSNLELVADQPEDGPPCCTPDLSPPRQPAVAVQHDLPRQGVSRMAEANEHSADVNRMVRNYGLDAKFVGNPRKIIFPKQFMQTCNLHTILYILYKETGLQLDIQQAFRMMLNTDQIGAEFLAKFGHPFEKGFSNRHARRFTRLMGGYAADLRIAQNGRLKLKHIARLAETPGFHVKVILQHGPDKFHAVMIEKIVRDADGKMSRVQFFDPNLGRIVEMPAGKFMDMAYRGQSYGGMQVFTWNPEGFPRRAGGNKLIGEHLRGELAGAGDSPRPSNRPRPHIDPSEVPDLGIDVSDVELIGSSANADRISNFNPIAGKTIDEMIETLHPGADKPILHITTLEGLDGIRRSGKYIYKDGFANFSAGGQIGAARNGNSAIRIRPDVVENHIFYKISDEDRGVTVHYYPQGKDAAGHFIGPKKLNLPIEILEQIDPYTGQWIPVKPYFNLDDL